MQNMAQDICFSFQNQIINQYQTLCFRACHLSTEIHIYARTAHLEVCKRQSDMTSNASHAQFMRYQFSTPAVFNSWRHPFCGGALHELVVLKTPALYWITVCVQSNSGGVSPTEILGKQPTHPTFPIELQRRQRFEWDQFAPSTCRTYFSFREWLVWSLVESWQ